MIANTGADDGHALIALFCIRSNSCIKYLGKLK